MITSVQEDLPDDIDVLFICTSLYWILVLMQSYRYETKTNWNVPILSRYRFSWKSWLLFFELHPKQNEFRWKPFFNLLFQTIMNKSGEFIKALILLGTFDVFIIRANFLPQNKMMDTKKCKINSVLCSESKKIWQDLNILTLHENKNLSLQKISS